MIRLLFMIVPMLTFGIPTAGKLPWIGLKWPQQASPISRSAMDCVKFQSPPHMAAGTAFRTALFRGLEFRLSAAWDIEVGPVEDPRLDYLWLVSPPLQTAPHRMIGRGYGLTARQSATIERPLRFVVTRVDYESARAVLDANLPADRTLQRLDELGQGHLSFVITAYRIRDGIAMPNGTMGDAFEWIEFKGEACAPRQRKL